ncbi:MAG: hypothetical protein IKH22_07490 [Prevotella sp.]|nr:hypothetical protein [Prevotella sp.]
MRRWARPSWPWALAAVAQQSRRRRWTVQP